MSKSVLKIKEGKYVKVRMFEDGPKLCVDDSQSKETVIVRQRNLSPAVQMAFEFNHNGNRYFPKVEGDSLKLERAGNGHNLSDGHWFERVNEGTGTHYCLKSVAAPRRYLCRQGLTLGLCQSRNNSVQVTHRKIREQASIKN